jgi:hypothetical protein
MRADLEVGNNVTNLEADVADQLRHGVLALLSGSHVWSELTCTLLWIIAFRLVAGRFTGLEGPATGAGAGSDPCAHALSVPLACAPPDVDSCADT